jgi:hypothetical protein
MNKEERLSKKARKLLEDARRKFAISPRAARQYLQAINPKELTMYDRQKIGREIIARAPPISIMFNEWEFGKFRNKIEEAYDLPRTQWNQESKIYERVEPLLGEARILTRKHAVKCEREMIKNLSWAIEEERSDGKKWRSYDGRTHRGEVRDYFRGAVTAYTALGKRDKVIECYDLLIDPLEKGLVRSISFSEDFIGDLKELKKERKSLIKSLNPKID